MSVAALRTKAGQNGTQPRQFPGRHPYIHRGFVMATRSVPIGSFKHFIMDLEDASPCAAEGMLLPDKPAVPGMSRINPFPTTQARMKRIIRRPPRTFRQLLRREDNLSSQPGAYVLYDLGGEP